jgi:tight adherence protein B
VTALVAWGAAGSVAVVVLILMRRFGVRARWRIVRPAQGRARWAVPAWASAPLPVTAVAFVGGFLTGGPVAATALASYGGLAAIAVRRRAARRRVDGARVEAADAVAALAAELRAGAAVEPAIGVTDQALDRADAIGGEAGVVARRIRAAIRVAETSGAPLAEVLDRLDEHLRAVDRARAAAAAQAAGAQASAGLLAVLPLAGLGLGALMGVDPWNVLLRTPVGAVALLVAIALQVSGIAWVTRLSRVEVSA